jgi:branched-chain amino acid transport system substrate-binding protein
MSLLLLTSTAAGCGSGSGDDDTGSDDASERAPEGVDAAELLGPEDVASGEPVKLGMVSDGATAAFDNTDEIRAAEATAAFWNEHRGGVRVVRSRSSAARPAATRPEAPTAPTASSRRASSPSR